MKRIKKKNISLKNKTDYLSDVHCVQVNTSFVVLPKNGEIFVYIIRGAKDNGNPLVNRGGLDVQNIHGPCGGHASRLLHDEGHGVTLIQQPQLKGEKQESDLLPKSPPSVHEESKAHLALGALDISRV